MRKPPPIDRKNVFEYVKACTWALPGECADLTVLGDCLRARDGRRLAALRRVLAELVEAGAIKDAGTDPPTWYTPRS